MPARGRSTVPSMLAAGRASLALAVSLALIAAPAPALAAPGPEVQRPASEDADDPGEVEPEHDADDDDQADAEGHDPATSEAGAPTAGEDALPVNEGEPPPAGEAVEEPGEPSAAPGEPATELPNVEAVDDAPVAVPVETLEAEQRAAAAEAQPPAPTADDRFAASLDYDPVRDHPKMPAARRWLGAGIAATVTGAALVGGAIALSQTAPCEPSAGNNCFADARDRAAVTMGVPGGLLLLGGIAMTTLGAIQRRRIKASVALAPGRYGVALSARF